jgi:hypothetical protein
MEQLWISASEFENFVKNDTISDCLATFQNNKRPHPHPLTLLFQKGIEYEEKVIARLREKTGLKLEKYSSFATSRDYPLEDKIGELDLNRVINSMKHGEPIIYSGYIFSLKECIRGIPDLLIRNDYIQKIFKNLPTIASGISKFGDYYYIPVEIKFSTITLDKSSLYISNIGRAKIYKTQLFTYNKILEDLQGFMSKNAFIISKRTISGSGDIMDPFDTPGIIDFSCRDNEVVKLFYEGLEWLKYVKNNKWNTQRIINEKIYPNMKADNPVFEKEKQEIANSVGEITEFFYCNTRNRKLAFDNSITSWKNPLLDANILGFYPGSKSIAERVDLLLKINRGELGDYYPSKILKNTRIIDIGNSEEIFVDFETVMCGLDMDSPLPQDERIFLIGVLYKGNYIPFLSKDLSQEEEYKVLIDFYNFWVSTGKPKIWYWYAETIMWKKAQERHKSLNPIEGFDLHKIFYEEPFVVRGCKNFKLKSYIKALKALGKIHIELPSETCGDGLKCMFLAYNFYMGTTKKMSQEILDYNKLDCQYLDILLNFIRELEH